MSLALLAIRPPTRPATASPAISLCQDRSPQPATLRPTRWLKADVETITGALDRVRKLRGVTFSRRETGNRGVGLIAQELAPIVPEAVMTHEDGLLSVAYGNLVGVLIEAVKDLADKVERLEAQP
ncbi:MAG: tail fiber domain-containing protein [Sphingomonadales bacterium]|nr:tail fiber domain-containing protein [Sphingomonadales bacterium]